MKEKVREKEKAIQLRKKGYSYKDILKEVPVAKSSLSLWLKDVHLTDSEKKYLKSRRDKNITRGRIKAASVLRGNRLERESLLQEEARREFKSYVGDSLFQVGVALYWAEGAKRNSYFSFSNSDTNMTNLMLLWIEKYLNISRDDINACLYIHKPYAHERCEEHWSRETNIPLNNFRKTIYKPTSRLVKKRPNYKGVLRISVTRKAPLLKMKFWIHMLSRHYNK